jgi:hypothetical protein
MMVLRQLLLFIAALSIGASHAYAQADNVRRRVYYEPCHSW